MSLHGFLGQRSRAFIITAGLLFVFLLGVINYTSGPDVSFLIFYMAPVFLASWYVGRGAGFLMCFASGLCWLVVALVTYEHFAHPLIPYWNVLVLVGFMLTLSMILSAFKKSLDHERELARTDYLTGTVNSRYFAELAEAEIGRARRHAHPFTVAYMDVDDFKQVNDRFGHTAGDALLRAVAETVKQNVRAIDVVARLGGDEFAVLLPETNEQAAEVAIRRIRRSLLGVARQHDWPVTFSVGVVTWDAPPASVDEMLRAADDLMYVAKSHGKNTIRHRVSNESANAA
ncbi:MAG TPA: diguanylate cyclase [Pyrinomonadaceae bacterium]|jgi:diguanylate cyclase (GGDEF)-like protein|nr:diguanylate cyclase [Pyrinomonadaceae bacterium]